MDAGTKLRSAVSGALLVGMLTFGAGQASAMPTLDHGLATRAPSTQVEQVRWVCGPWRCFWRPNYWGFLSTLASVGYLSALVATVGLLSSLAAMGLRIL